MMSTVELERRAEATPEPHAQAGTRNTWLPYTDIVGADNEALIVVDMPGVDEKSANVVLERNVLTISGVSSFPAPDGCELVREEFPMGEFKREFEISAEFDTAQIKGQMKDGVLTVVLPKGEAAKPRKINIQTA